MDQQTTILLSAMILVAALLYSSVGHAGASGYLAAMALLNVSSGVMKPTALALNILVACVTTYNFVQAGHFSLRIFLPLAAGSVPLAFLGGGITLPGTLYKPVVGVVLLVSAGRMFLSSAQSEVSDPKRLLQPWLAVPTGMVIGFLSGLTGVGGGIFLTPLLLMAKWARTREASGISAAFILVNSVAGLLGHVSSVKELPAPIPLFALVALTGGIIGSRIGSRNLNTFWLRILLGVVLVIAGIKLVIG